jgi:hypothetical protein
MTSKEGRPGGVSLQRGTDEVGQPSVCVVTSPAWRTGSRAHHQLGAPSVGHIGTRLHQGGGQSLCMKSPRRFTCPESKANPPWLGTLDSHRHVPLILKSLWADAHGRRHHPRCW